MNTEKFMKASLLLAMTTLIALGGLWQPAAAKSGIYRLQVGKTIELGRQGLHATNIPVGVTSVYLDMVGGKLPARFSQKVDLKYRLPPMEVRFLNEKGGPVEKISALVYVFFNITRGERARWLKGGMDEIAIWYVSEETGSWDLCPTFFVDESRDNGTADRLACLAPASGYYALGHGDFGELLAKPASAEKATGAGLAGKIVPQ